MSDYEDDEPLGGDDWVFYRDRPEWKDVTPLKQDEGDEPIVAIAYSERFRDVYDYMRAIVMKNEMSDRAFNLTKDALSLNPANYTVWQFRRALLKELKKDLWTELNYVAQMIEDYPKNYQVWHHRMVIIEWLQCPDQELAFLERALAQDPKNYHAWKHRQWVIKKFDLTENELAYTEKLIDLDIRNNSAWNQRYFIISLTSQLSDRDSLEREMYFAIKHILKATFNESPWNYLRGLMIHMEKSLLEPKLMEFAENLYSSGDRSPHLLGLLVDIAIESEDHAKKERAKELCKDLATTYDKIRAKYWDYVSSKLTI